MRSKSVALPGATEIARIAEIVQTMLGDAMRAYSNEDSTLADAVIARDREVDALRRDVHPAPAKRDARELCGRWPRETEPLRGTSARACR
jgi:hypothetical protein